MIWHVVTRVGDADMFQPDLPADEPRVYFGLRRGGDPDSLGPDVVASIAEIVGELPSDSAADLLTVSTAAFAADLRIPRDIEPDRWTREFRLYVPVTDPSLWASLAPLLSRLLGFLTGDVWHFE